VKPPDRGKPCPQRPQAKLGKNASMRCNVTVQQGEKNSRKGTIKKIWEEQIKI
jgi:hypothetical protein